MRVIQKLKGARKPLYCGVPLFILFSSCHLLFNKRQLDSSEIIGVYDHSYSQKGVDIPDYIRYSILTLEKDSTFLLKSGCAYEFDETITGIWEVSSDTLFLQIRKDENSAVNSVLHYKIKNSNTLFILPLNKRSNPFKKRN